MFGLGQLISLATATPASLSTMWLQIAHYASAQATMPPGVIAMGYTRFTNGLRALANNNNVRAMSQQWLALPASNHRNGLIAISNYAAAMAHAYAVAAGVASPTGGSVALPTAMHGIGSYY